MREPFTTYHAPGTPEWIKERILDEWRVEHTRYQYVRDRFFELFYQKRQLDLPISKLDNTTISIIDQLFVIKIFDETDEQAAIAAIDAMNSSELRETLKSIDVFKCLDATRPVSDRCADLSYEIKQVGRPKPSSASMDPGSIRGGGHKSSNHRSSTDFPHNE